MSIFDCMHFDAKDGDEVVIGFNFEKLHISISKDEGLSTTFAILNTEQALEIAMLILNKFKHDLCN